MDSIFLFLTFVGLAVGLAWGGYSTKPEHGFLRVLSYIGAVGCVTGAIAVAILSPIYNGKIDALNAQIAALKATPSSATETSPALIDTTAPTPSPTISDEHLTHPYDPSLTPQYLIALFKGRTEAQGRTLAEPYKGKEIGVSGQIYNIDSSNPTRTGLTVILEGTHSQPVVMMSFDPKWSDQLNALHIGDTIAALGVITQIEPEFVALDNCRIVSIGRASKAK
jgi:hypothetical protein